MKALLLINYILSSKDVELPEGSRIINGQLFKNPHKFCWMVGLVPTVRKDIVFCGGSLINENTVVTAAHCKGDVPLPLENILIAQGISDFTDPSQLKSGNYRKINDFIVHPDYINTTKQNDIAIIKLSSPIYCDKYVDLDDGTVANDFAHPAVIMGWGKTDFAQTKPAPTQLKYARIEITNIKYCKLTMRSFLKVWVGLKENICARKLGGGQIDTCQGDSGGPLFIDICDRQRLVGITSFGVNCGLPLHPGIYTRIEFYLDFIAQYSILE